MGLARVGKLERALARGARRLRHHDVVVRRATRRAACMLAGAPASPARWRHLCGEGRSLRDQQRVHVGEQVRGERREQDDARDLVQASHEEVPEPEARLEVRVR